MLSVPVFAAIAIADQMMDLEFERSISKLSHKERQMLRSDRDKSKTEERRHREMISAIRESKTTIHYW